MYIYIYVPFRFWMCCLNNIPDALPPIASGRLGIESALNAQTNLSPHGWGGDMFVNFCVLNHICQLWQRMANYAISIDNLFQKYNTRFGKPEPKDRCIKRELQTAINARGGSIHQN